MGFRPIVYSSQNYANYINSTVPAVYPHLWIARWPQGSGNQFAGICRPTIRRRRRRRRTSTASGIRTTPSLIRIPTGTCGRSGNTRSGERLQSFNNGGSNLDGDVANGGIEFLKDHLVPALWMNDSSGDWSTLANWNSGQTPSLAGTGRRAGGPGRNTDAAHAALARGGRQRRYLRPARHRDSRPPEREYHGDALHRHAQHSQAVRARALNITGGSLSVNYDPATWDSPLAVEFACFRPVLRRRCRSAARSLSVHTLQVDAARTFTLERRLAHAQQNRSDARRDPGLRCSSTAT